VLFDEIFRSKRFTIQGVLQGTKEMESDGASSGLYDGCGNIPTMLQQFLPSDQTCMWSRIVVVKHHILTID